MKPGPCHEFPLPQPWTRERSGRAIAQADHASAAGRSPRQTIVKAEAAR